MDIIKVHARACELPQSIDLQEIARRIEWWSGEEIRQLISLSKLENNLIDPVLLSTNIDHINDRINSKKRMTRMQELLSFTKEHSNVRSIREDSLLRHAHLLSRENNGIASPSQTRFANDGLQLHPNIEVLIARMDDDMKRADFSGVLHSSASIFETLAKEVVGLPSVQNETLGRFFQRYRQDSALPPAVLDYVLSIYNSRNVTPLAGHGSTATPSLSRQEAVALAEMTKAFVRIEYSLRQRPTQR